MKLVICLVIFCAAVQAHKFDLDKVIVRRPIPESLRRLYPGLIDSDFEGRIVGGNEATPHQFPHQVAIFFKIPQGTAFCGGSLISEQWIMTAGHCADGASNFTVYLGAHNIKEEEPSRKEIEFTSDNAHVHPEYDPKLILNDIALLKLPSPVELTDEISTIRLPSRSQQNNDFAGLDSIISGWGADRLSGGVSPVLRYVENPILTNDECKKNMLGLAPITENNICQSGKGTKGACSGDSGGPLKIVEEDGKNTVVGVTSFVVLGCRLSIPTAYTRVTSYLDFIESTTGIEIRP